MIENKDWKMATSLLGFSAIPVFAASCITPACETAGEAHFGIPHPDLEVSPSHGCEWNDLGRRTQWVKGGRAEVQSCLCTQMRPSFVKLDMINFAT